MRGKTLVFVLALFLLASFAHAYSEVNIIPVNNEISPDETALFRLSVNNRAETSQTYSFFSTNFDWSINTVPVNTKLTVSANETGTIDLEVVPFQRFDAGIYLIPIVVKSTLGESYTKTMKVYLGADAPQNYQPSIATSVDVSENIDPRNTQSIKVFLQNQNPINYSNLLITLKSDLDEFEKEQTVDLKPFESKTVEFTVVPDPHTQPKEYYLFFALKSGEQVIKTFEQKVSIVPLTIPFTAEETVESSFLKTVSTITFTNDGNVRNEQPATVPMSALKDLVTSTDPNAYSLKDGQGSRYLAWDLELGVGESATVTVTTSYRIPVIILVVLIAFLIFYFIYKNPLQVTKAASNVLIDDVGVSGLKITIVVKNLGSKPIKDVEVFDTAPSITSVEKDVEIGTLKPTDILRNKKGGILLKWKISELEGKEERLITYKIKSKLDIFGTIFLQRAKVKFKNRAGKERISYSNTYRVGTEQENKE